MSELRMNHSFESVPFNDLVKLICFNEAFETSAVFFGSIKLGLTISSYEHEKILNMYIFPKIK